MQARWILWGLLALWAVVWLGSFWASSTALPTGDGFTRGLNRVTTFLGWQLAAAALGLLAWAIGRHAGVGAAGRWIARIPVLLGGGLFLGLLVLVLYAGFIKPAPDAGPVGRPPATQLPAVD